MPEVSKSKAKQQSPEEILGEKIAAKVNAQVESEEEWKNPRESEIKNMIGGLIEGFIHSTVIENKIESVNESLPAQEKMYIFFGNEILDELDERIKRKRIQSQRNISSTILSQAKAVSSEKSRSKRKKKSADDDESGISAKKISTKDLGKEMEDEAKMMEELEESRKKEMEEAENIRKQHANAYKQAFYFFGRIIAKKTKGDQAARELIENIYKIGEDNLMTRQLAIEKVSQHPKSILALHPLLAALRDKNISNYAVIALGKISSFTPVPKLIDMVIQNPAKRDALIRGLALQSIGDILILLHKQKKNSGIKQIFAIVKQESFEPNLEKLISILRKDIQDEEMRKNAFQPQCIVWMILIGEKLMELKKKDMKVAFLKMSMATPLTKSLKELCETMKKYKKSK